jgi:hypothetical protein
LVTANAFGGATETGAGKATSNATGDGASGTVQAIAHSTPFSNAPILISTIEASTSIALHGAKASDEAISKFGGGLVALSTDTATAEAIASPTGYSSVLNAYAAIKTAFGPSPTIFALGELGGAYSGTSSSPETTTSAVTENINLAKLGASGHYALGLYGGAVANAADVSQVVLTVFGPGGYLYDQTLTASQAMAAFSGTAPSLNLSAFTNSGTASITITLSVTTTGAGAGFSGDFIFGDPPLAQANTPASAATHAYTHDVQAFGLAALSEVTQTGVAGRAFEQRDLYRDASGNEQAAVLHLANGSLDVQAYGNGLTFASSPTGEAIHLHPGSFADTFVFDRAFGTETVHGYMPGADNFDINHALFSNFDAMMSHAQQHGADVVITYDATDVLTLTGVTVAELHSHAADFHFI